MNASLKKYIVARFAASTSEKDFSHDQIILLTSSGLIRGTYPADKNNGSNTDSFLAYMEQINSQYEDEFNNGDILKDINDGYVILKDVTVMNGSSKTYIPTLVVFFSEIVGVTFCHSEDGMGN